MKNLEKCITDLKETSNNTMSNTSQEENPTLHLLTGPPKELSPPLKTKDHADHAGLSVLPDLLKEPTSTPRENCYLSLNKNQLTVLHLSETQDVMEDSWMTVSNSSKKTESRLKITTLIPGKMDNVMLPKKELALSKSAHLLMFLKTLPHRWLTP